MTPALRRWDELAERDPEVVGATRHLSPDELAEAGRDVRDFAAMQAFRIVPRNHPVFWAAFVFHGASQPLDDNSNAVYDSATAVRRTAPPEGMMSDDENTANDGTGQSAGDKTPAADERAPGYFPAASEVCPRCHAQDYIPVRDPQGQDMRQCMSCGKLYLPGQNADGEGQ